MDITKYVQSRKFIGTTRGNLIRMGYTAREAIAMKMQAEKLAVKTNEPEWVHVLRMIPDELAWRFAK